jgi:hypothetical protein
MKTTGCFEWLTVDLAVVFANNAARRCRTQSDRQVGFDSDFLEFSRQEEVWKTSPPERPVDCLTTCR